MHITWHRQCDSSVHIVPCEFNPNVYFRFHVDCDELFGYEGVLKKFSILCRAILDIEIVNHQTEKCFLDVMDPEAGCVLHWMIPEWSHMFYQLLVCYYASLFEAIHALLDGHVDLPLVVNQCIEVISVDDILWDDFKRNPHKLRVW